MRSGCATTIRRATSSVSGRISVWLERPSGYGRRLPAPITWLPLRAGTSLYVAFTIKDVVGRIASRALNCRFTVHREAIGDERGRRNQSPNIVRQTGDQALQLCDPGIRGVVHLRDAWCILGQPPCFADVPSC